VPKMTDSELVSVIMQAKEDAATYTGEFSKENEKYLSAYLAQKNFEFKASPDQSSVVSTDIFDVVEADMPSLARVFLGSGDIMSFTANTDNENELQEVEDKTKFVNWVVRNQPESYKTQIDWLKDAEIQKCGVVKYYYDESKDVEEVEFKGVDAQEIQEIIESLRGADVDKVEISEQEESEELEVFDVKFRVTREKKCIKIINIPSESFLITKNATSKHDADIVGDVCFKTRSELLADGFPRKLIEQLPAYGEEDKRNSGINQIRNSDQDGDVGTVSMTGWATQKVQIYDLYARVDFDGDGIAEDRHIMICGNKVLVNDYFNHRPYAMLSAIPIPHKAIGRSRAEVTYQTQLEKTALKRGLLDNIYQANAPRNVVHPDVDLDDMLTMRQNGIIRLDDDTTVLPQNAVFPLITQYTGDKTLQVIQYVDQSRANSTGALMSSQGLDADAIAKETATRFEGIEKSGSAKIELIARNYAETGYRDLFEGIAWIASRYQDTEAEFTVLGKAMTVNPSKWKYNHHVETNVGLGAGNNEALVGALQGIYQIQLQLKAQGSQLVDEVDIFNTLKRITDGLGLPRVDELFNNPEEPDELLKAQNEQLNQIVLQLQEQIQMAGNPLAESEKVKAEATLIKAQGDAQVKLMDMERKQSEFISKMQAEKDKWQDELALKLTEMEQQYKQQLDAQLQQNKAVVSE
jgi:hypothetical protein